MFPRKTEPDSRNSSVYKVINVGFLSPSHLLRRMTMKKVLVLAVIFSIHTNQAFALPTRVVYSQDIDSSSVELKIAKGYGLT